jgi:hypothetical protein
MILGLALIAGCTTTQEIKRPNGDVEYLIACGASLGWNICYDRANQVCPRDTRLFLSKVGSIGRNCALCAQQCCPVLIKPS